MTNQTPCGLGAAQQTDQTQPHLNPWRVAKTPNAHEFVRSIIELILQSETEMGLRKRSRRSNDDATFRKAASAIIADLAHVVLTGRTSGVRISRSNGRLNFKSRFKTPLTTKSVPTILDLMALPTIGLIRQVLGTGAMTKIGVQTVIYPSGLFVSIVRSRNLSLDDFAEDLVVEPIELKGHKSGRKKSAPLLTYKDTDQTIWLRKEMHEINQYLVKANIDYLGSEDIDLGQRQLRRIFTRGSFSSGGRLYGGFWQSMSKQDRLFHLRLDGEPVVELDYGQVMPRLLYSMSDHTPQMEDLYNVAGFEDCRSGIKKVFSAMVFADKPLKRFPKGTRDLFHEGTKVAEVTAAILSTHKDIRDYFHNGFGHQCQFIESRIMVQVLRVFLGIDNGRGIALPIHDAILVPESMVEIAIKVMRYNFELTTKQKASIDILTAGDLGLPKRITA